MKRLFFLMFVLALSCGASFAQEQNGPRLFHQPTVNQTHIAFSYAGDIWIVERGGGQARRLTTDPANEDFPIFSPDGTQLAFSKVVGGDWDVFVMPAAGGEARQITYNPEMDIVRAWTPDGRNILFVSHRDEENVYRLYSMPFPNGVHPTMLPLPVAINGSYSADGTRIAYTPRDSIGSDWRFYRGGKTSQIAIARLSDSHVEKLSTGEVNDRFPMWIGDKIYFVSDRNAIFNLYVYDSKTKLTKQLTTFEKHGIRYATATKDAIVLVRAGRLHLFDLKTNQARVVPVGVDADMSALKPRTVNASRWIESASLSSKGDRIIFGARGEALLFDPAKNESRNLTATSGAAERYPALSPDGRLVAYFSDESGEYQLHVRAASGEGAVKKIAIEPKPTFYRELVWSPDSKRVTFADKHFSIWCADLDRTTITRIDTSTYSDQDRFYPAWSPDGRWLAYSKNHSNRIGTIYIYDTQAGKKHQITDGSIHAELPIFDASGRYLYFTSSGLAGLSEFGWGVLGGIMARSLVSRRLHLVVLENDKPSPLLSNLQPNPEVKTDERATGVRIDFEEIHRRIITLPLQSRDYAELAPGKPGSLYALVTEYAKSPGLGSQPTQTLYQYNLSKPRDMEKLVEGLHQFIASADGEKLLYRRGQVWALVDADKASKAENARLDLKSLEVKIEPAAEYKQIFHEAWRVMRDYFYDPNHHGQNLAELERHYGEYLPSVARRADLNDLMRQMLGHISVSHLGVGGGDAPPPGPPSRIGLLGADYRIDQNRYQITKVYRSVPLHSPSLNVSAPLDQPGMNVKEGEYLLAIDGQEIDATKSIFAYFVGKAGQAVKLKIGPKPDGASARVLTVVPGNGENTLRLANWAERNRRRVEELSGGRLGYIYVPDYGMGIEDFYQGVLGYRDNKQGLIIDQRYNGGGITSDAIIEMLNRKPLYYYRFREGEDIATPTNPVSGPKVLITNEYNGSAAETFAFMFKLARVGTIVGKRTGGGGIGPYGFSPDPIDGGGIQIPSRGAYNPNTGGWDIENYGITPDIDVEILPKDWLAGRDTQIEKAVEVAMRELTKTRPATKLQPKYPVHK
jgi:tricorn protease